MTGRSFLSAYLLADLSCVARQRGKTRKDEAREGKKRGEEGGGQVLGRGRNETQAESLLAPEELTDLTGWLGTQDRTDGKSKKQETKETDGTLDSYTPL
jgi:hypothetical protein